MKQPFNKSFYFPLFVFALILSVIGIVNLYSATISLETNQLSDYFKAQLIYTLVGIVIMLMASFVSISRWYSLSPFIYGFALALLVLVLLMGSKTHGSLSWLDLGFVRLQPSEFGKFGLVMMLARFLANLQKDEPLSFGEMCFMGLVFIIPTGLVIAQNDLGSSLFYGFIFGTMIFLQGVKFRYIVIALIVIGVLGMVSYTFVLKDYQKARIASFMKPELDPKGSGYHLVQSKIAVGSGRLMGKGYLKGQSHRLKFLPERHTDFIFPVLAEEWGFVGGGVTLLCYFLFLMMGLNVASESSSRFGFFVAAGVTATYFWHLVINLGGVLGLMPLTGVPLPFLS
ncbi:MAG TPA: rod shape-determining protein RodA, partial [bacterium]|nr:rod shape-determining protein RodA [bacterium]